MGKRNGKRIYVEGKNYSSKPIEQPINSLYCCLQTYLSLHSLSDVYFANCSNARASASCRSCRLASKLSNKNLLCSTSSFTLHSTKRGSFNGMGHQKNGISVIYNVLYNMREMRNLMKQKKNPFQLSKFIQQLQETAQKHHLDSKIKSPQIPKLSHLRSMVVMVVVHHIKNTVNILAMFLLYFEF